jgi:serine/threonine-protein kinase
MESTTEQQNRGRIVSLKIMPYEAGTIEAQAWVKEAEIAKQLEHPNIVKTFANGERHGKHFCVMEFLEGEFLSHILYSKEEGFSEKEAANIILQIAEALHYAEVRNLV